MRRSSKGTGVRWSALLGCAVALGLIVEACHTATDIQVHVLTSASCSDAPSGDHVFGELIIAGGKPEVVQATGVGAASGKCAPVDAVAYGDLVGAGYGPNDLGTLELLPADDENADVEVVVVAAIRATGTTTGITAQRCAKWSIDHMPDSNYRNADDKTSTLPLMPCVVETRHLSFVKWSHLDLPIQLDAACEGVPCSPGSTCFSGVCKSNVITHDDCRMNKCEPRAGVGGASPTGATSGVSASNGVTAVMSSSTTATAQQSTSATTKASSSDSASTTIGSMSIGSTSIATGSTTMASSSSGPTCTTPACAPGGPSCGAGNMCEASGCCVCDMTLCAQMGCTCVAAATPVHAPLPMGGGLCQCNGASSTGATGSSTGSGSASGGSGSSTSSSSASSSSASSSSASGAAASSSSSGTMMCAVNSPGCQMCEMSSCYAEMMACFSASNTTCQSARTQADGCICQAQTAMSSTQLSSCMATFSAAGPTESSLAMCMHSSCGTQCGV